MRQGGVGHGSNPRSCPDSLNGIVWRHGCLLYVQLGNTIVRAVFGRGDRIPAPGAKAPALGREGASWVRQAVLILALGYVAYLLVQVAGGLTTWITHRTEVLLALTGIACWRWGWFFLQNARAFCRKNHPHRQHAMPVSAKSTSVRWVTHVVRPPATRASKYAR